MSTLALTSTSHAVFNVKRTTSKPLHTSINQVTNPWGSLPPLGNLDAYISAANRMPMLTLEEEQRFAKDFQQNQSLAAAQKLVLSHLRLVVAVSRKYLGYGLPHADLIQEGNIGLMKAVKGFNPDQGVRLVSYAMHWVKAEIHEYVIKNWRMVKIATTKAQRKLFFNLRSIKQNYKNHADADAHNHVLSNEEVQRMANSLDVKPEEVREMEMRLAGADVWLDPTDNNGDGDHSLGPIAHLSDVHHEPTHQLEVQQRDMLATDGISKALATLDSRSRHIVEQRWLCVNDDNSGGMTLHDLASIHQVSAERIRQLEVAAMKKMKLSLES